MSHKLPIFPTVQILNSFFSFQITVWPKYQKICDDAEGRSIAMNKLERFEFYERAKTAYAIVATGESSPYGNIIIKKGVVSDE